MSSSLAELSPTEPYNFGIGDQEPFIQSMQALGFTANAKGVCFGLSHSARDEYHEGSFTSFCQHLKEIQDLYTSTKKTILDKWNEVRNIEFTEINKMINEISSATSTNEQKKETLNKITNKMAALKVIASDLSEYENDPNNSSLAKHIQNKIAQKIDVVTQTKLEVLNNIADEFKQINNHENYKSLYVKINDLADLSHKVKEQKIEDLFNELSNDPATKLKINFQLKQKLINIPEEKLNFLNQTKALFSRIELYQQAHLYPEWFEEKSISMQQRKNEKIVYPLVETNQLQNQGGVDRIISFTGCYTPHDLIEYYQSLKQSLTSTDFPIVLNLSSYNHAIMTSYNPLSQLFTFYNPSESIEIISDAEKIAEKVMDGLSKRNIYVLSEIPDPDKYQKYINHYIAIKTPPEIYYIDKLGKLNALTISNINEYKNAVDDYDHLLKEKLKPLEDIIKANKGHESLGSSVAIFTTHVSILKKNASELLIDKINNWHMNDLSLIHKVTPEKIQMVDAFEKSWFSNAVFSGDIETIKQFIKNNVEVEYKYLSWAIKNGSSELVDMLIPQVKTPLVSASALKDTEVIKVLLERKIDSNQMIDGFSALAISVMGNDISLAEILLENGANPNYPNPNDPYTPKNLAISNGFDNFVDLFKNHELKNKSSASSTSLIFGKILKSDNYQNSQKPFISEEEAKEFSDDKEMLDLLLSDKCNQAAEKGYFTLSQVSGLTAPQFALTLSNESMAILEKKLATWPQLALLNDFNLKALLTPAGLQALEENLFKISDLKNGLNDKLKQDGKLALLLSKNGLEALRCKKLSIDDASQLTKEQLTVLLSNNGLSALKNDLINPTQARSLDKYGDLCYNLKHQLSDYGLSTLQKSHIKSEHSSALSQKPKRGI